MTTSSDLGWRARRHVPALLLALALVPAAARAQYVVREPMLQQFIADHDALLKSDAAALQRWNEAGYRTVDLQLVQSSVDIYLAGLKSMALGRQSQQLDCAAGVDRVYWEHLIAAETYTLLNRYCPRLVALSGQAQGGAEPPAAPPPSGKPVASVTKVVGEVLVRGPGSDWHPLTGGSLGVNDEIATGVGASLTITFTDGTTLDYGELTRGLLSDVQTVEDRIKIRVLLKMGEIGAQVPKQEVIRSDFSIKSPTLAASVRGTRFTVRYDTLTKVSTVAVQEGVVVVLPDAAGSHEIEVFRDDVLAVGPAGSRWVRQAPPATSPPAGAVPRPEPAAAGPAAGVAPPVSAPPSQPGAGARVPVAVVPSDMMFQASKPVYGTTNDAVNIQFAGFPGNAEDCITIAAPDSPPEQWLRRWCANGLRAGTVAWADLPPGFYEARAHIDWTRQQGAIRARTYFQVGSGGAVVTPPVVTPAPAPTSPPTSVPVNPPASTPTPPSAGAAAGALAGFSFIDGTEDRVGTYEAITPNGNPDVHFRVWLQGDLAVASVGVFATDAGGTRIGNTGWSTDPTAGLWMPSLFRGGVRLNTTRAPFVGTFTGTTVLDVYGEGANYAPLGSYFAVEVKTADGRVFTKLARVGDAVPSPAPPPAGVPTAPANPPMGPAVPGSPLTGFSFIDGTEDRVGAYETITPNGNPDVHFRVWLQGDLAVASLGIFATDAGGTSRSSTGWSTDATAGLWMPSLFRGGARLNTTRAPFVGTFTGSTVLDVYGEGANYAPLGSYFAVEVKTADGRVFTKLARVGDAPPAQAAPPAAGANPPAPPPTATGATALVDFVLVDRNGDRVSHGDAQPNGARDAHFRLTLDLNGEEVRAIRVFEANADGNTIGAAFWRSDPTSGNWWLGAAANGSWLATTFAETMGRLQGRVALDLYADGADSYARPGQLLAVEVMLGDGRQLKRLIRAP